ncbi:MAG TPA: hypothetical protein PLD20_07040 [Blastocatellia bacterium]|nr:hypothetical protein [Blastocatellia bacterium]HMV81542.1 hypothetical protein [Blastocatellia bacterium]HMX30509.1 hypothetical protein [Blastocatellia bacterium]HMZ17665.1 hypothetical protein [Blastocatellia bacterium]HNG28527.1 hypothetical protein [Blastocatellia bacterium]
MEITINLPERVFANLSVLAGNSRRRIDEVIVEKIEHAFASESDELAKQISLCSDREVLEIARMRLSVKQDARLSGLLKKQGEELLMAKEQNELWKLMEENRLVTLKKAFALREMNRRGLPEPEHEKT